MKRTDEEELVVGIFHHPDLHHPSGGGREEEWAESQQGSGVVDVDECANGTVCGNYGFCENTDGSFRCQCDQGYTNPPGDASRCADVDECEMSPALCGEALCENFDGSFLCICPNDNEEFDPITSHCRSLAGGLRGEMPGPTPLDKRAGSAVAGEGMRYLLEARLAL
ncbi:Latent-transforming growth factor beta-binding protein 2 [Liparis tanakae]|uniref:Latent-transforming growth factor beta-binding protein 2 n=1 Tax=Liparis tanakae TaxID=230148 RepID=A0A4Z2H5V1_9TELE|nr:Latent-transforming growth factor beta-binding protein 2 [Liparis tanakae]